MSLHIEERYCDRGLVENCSKTFFTLLNYPLGLFAFRNILGDQQCRLVSVVLQGARCYFDVDRAAVFQSMAPLARMAQFRPDLCLIIERASNIIRGSYIFNSHLKELFK